MTTTRAQVLGEIEAWLADHPDHRVSFAFDDGTESVQFATMGAVLEYVDGVENGVARFFIAVRLIGRCDDCAASDPR
jgi:hypothetical protein